MPTPRRPFGDNFVLAVRHYLETNSLKSLNQINAEVLADIAERFYSHFTAQQKARKKTGSAASQEANDIYQAYPRKIGRETALRAIATALEKNSADLLLRATRHYCSCVQRWPAAYRYQDGRDLVPYPASWFNAGRFADDSKEWLPAGMHRRDDDPDLASPNNRHTDAVLLEPSGWQERVKTHEELAVHAGRSWETINPYYQRLISRL